MPAKRLAMWHVEGVSGSCTEAEGLNGETYRYDLTRSWKERAGRMVTWIMLNPSTADGRTDDRTVAKISRFTRRWGFDGLTVVNLFALRSTDPYGLIMARDPIGPENDEYIRKWTRRPDDLVLCAWGSFPSQLRASRVAPATRDRAATVVEGLVRAGVKLHALALTSKGYPWHPLFMLGNTDPREWINADLPLGESTLAERSSVRGEVV